MALFSQEQADKYSEFENEVLLVDRIVEEANKVLLVDKVPDLHKIKSTLFDLVVLKRLLDKLKLKIDYPEPIKSIRDSVAHVDERLDSFDFRPTIVKDIPVKRQDWRDGTFKLTINPRFQGAISKAVVAMSGEVRALGPYGMVDDNFIWIDRNGKQKHTPMQDIRNAYLAFLNSAQKTLGT